MKTKLKFFQQLLLVSIIAALVSCGDDNEDPTVDCSASDLIVTIASSTESSCSGGGSITVSATGGIGSVEFSSDGTNFQSSTTFEDLSNGSYTITARDVNGCTATVAATVTGDVGDVSFTTEVENSDCGTSGSITVTASGGDSNYQYRIDGGAFGSSNVFSGLAQGSYTLTVQDGNTCDDIGIVTVQSGISLANDIMPIIENNCAVTGCHADNQSPILSTASAIMNSASRIKARTQAGTMPPGSRSITQQEIALIACWVDDGGLDN